MSVVEFIKNQNQKIQKRIQAELSERIEPQIRDFSERLSKKIFDTKNSQWLSKIALMYEGKPSQFEGVSDAVRELYGKLSVRLGEEVGVGEWFTVDQERIDRFAKVTEDEQWIHVDPERAKKESPFRTTVSHGFLTLSLIPKLTESVEHNNSYSDEARMVVNLGLNRVRFPHPAKSGSQIRAKMTLKKLVCLKKSIEIVNEITVEVKSSSRLVCVAETVMRVYI